MANTQFQEKLFEVLRSLEELSQYPQWQHLCNSAREAEEPTLEDATKAVLQAAYYLAEPIIIPTLEEIFGC
ncbi:hypothetical protein F7734_52155 [Scytonema sp. UIC 10036]|uniref:hypothetical protein n=1 Tax=Scytonema sp. UIC 10036 TaxID=2304196 RepID=UPI0012DAC383|nr:hypothetical protein [Scytonema sp. UIC 10036]MUH00377.1 hypothetical protein [Scytonema sp. UIC 10036]